MQSSGSGPSDTVILHGDSQPAAFNLSPLLRWSRSLNAIRSCHHWIRQCSVYGLQASHSLRMKPGRASICLDAAGNPYPSGTQTDMWAFRTSTMSLCCQRCGRYPARMSSALCREVVVPCTCCGPLADVVVFAPRGRG